MNKFLNKFSKTVDNISDVVEYAKESGIDYAGDELNIGRTKNIVIPINYYIEKLGYDPSLEENELPDTLGPVGQRKEEALKQAKTIENYYRIMQYIGMEIDEILGQ